MDQIYDPISSSEVVIKESNFYVPNVYTKVFLVRKIRKVPLLVLLLIN